MRLNRASSPETLDSLAPKSTDPTERASAVACSWASATATVARRVTSTTPLEKVVRMVDSSSAQEGVARRVVRSVDLLVTADATASNHTDVLRVEGRCRVDRRRMSGANMTALAEHRRSRHEHAIVVRSMRIVACTAGFPAGGVLEEEGTALLGVTADAGLVHPHPHAQLLDVGRPVRVVARGAVHLALAHRHVCRALQLHRLRAMTRGTEIDHTRLLQLRMLALWRMDRMARDARHVARIVHTSLPPRVLTAVVTGDAGRADIARGHGRKALDRIGHRRILDVLTAGTVAAFTALRGGWGTWIGAAAVRRLVVAVAGFGLVGMATDTRVAADKSGADLSGRERGLS